MKSRIPKHAQKVFTGVIYDIYQWEQELFDGTYTTFEMASRANAVNIIPVIDDTIVVLHEQQPTHSPHIGFPGGHIEPGEEPLEAAVRELHEETGMVFGSMKLVGIDNIGGPKLDWWVYRYIATDLVRIDEPHLDPGEKIEVEQVTFAAAKQLAANNVYMSAPLMASMDTLDQLLQLPEISL